MLVTSNHWPYQEATRMPVQFTAAEIGRTYDKLAPWYDRFDIIAEYLAFRRLRRSWFPRASGDVLEVAVGTGRNLPFYASSCRLTAIDVSQGMMQRARERAEMLGKRVEFRLMNAEDLKFPDDSFDTVSSSLSTCTFPDPVAALREMKRVCRPDGRILLFEHGRSSFGPAGWLQDRLAERHARGAGCHWNREPVQLVNQAGLRLISERRSLLGVLYLIEAVP
jgi:ubiquinone/menaquinone biosynthesis C-methylase UbiE